MTTPVAMQAQPATALIAASHYQLAWVLCGLFPLLAIPLVPTRLIPVVSADEIHERRGAGQ